MKNSKIILLSFISILLFACKNDNMETILKEEPCATDTISSVSYSQNIQPIFTKNCSTTGCHSGNNPEGGLNLESALSYAELSKAGSGYVDSINPKKSLLYSVLVSKSNPMPPSGNLDQCTIDLIEKWMEQKAKNN